MATSNGKKLTNPEVYDYCVYQDFKSNFGPAPSYDSSIIARNKASKTKPGPMAWISDNQDIAFRYIMFSIGNPFVFNKKQEQEIINEFWGVDLRDKPNYKVTDQDQVVECRQKRPVRSGEDEI